MSAPRLALPALGPATKLKLPTYAERTLANGLTIIAVRRAAVPLMELRLRVPFAKAPLARAMLLGQSLFSGTSVRSSMEIAAGLQAVGGALGASLDPDWLNISGNCLSSGLGQVLGLLAEIVTDAAYPADEVAAERDRLVDHLQVAASQPAHLARVALLKHRYGSHAYAVQTPEVEQVQAVKSGHLRVVHDQRMSPRGAQLVLVGDLPPKRALDLAEKALADWANPAEPKTLPRVPKAQPGPLTMVNRPGSVQSSLRLALPAVHRAHSDYPAMNLANLVFGGYFSSRWVENIREDKGYTYGPHSYVEHASAGSMLVVAAEVATEVTAPALLETFYELGRLSAVPPAGAELEQARQYALGSLRIGMATQSGLASLVSAYAAAGMRLEDAGRYAAALTATTAEEVAAAAVTYLSPLGAVAVVLGDADRVGGSVGAVMPYERG